MREGVCVLLCCLAAFSQAVPVPLEPLIKIPLSAVRTPPAIADAHSGFMDSSPAAEPAVALPKESSSVALAQVMNTEPHTQKELLIAVVSAPKHFAARQAIRDTYQKHAAASGRVDVKFFVGQLAEDLEDRAEVDRAIGAELDMVRFEDFTESYHNLSSKAIDIFDYGHRNGYHAVFKADDDSYVRVNLLLNFWDAHGNDPYLYGGSFVDGKAAMVDDPKSKWYMKDQYPHDSLEDYANGPGVLLGGRALDFFHRHHATLFRYRVDDAGIGIWLKDLPMEKRQMTVDDYSWTIHPEAVWISPANPQEMQLLFESKPVNLQVCKETCLCHGGPKKDTTDCITWDSFTVASYKDLVPRLTQVDVETKTIQ